MHCPSLQFQHAYPAPAGFRGRIITSRKDLWKGGPFKPLTEGLRRSGGRNAQGRITSRHRGGGHRRVYRLVDFKRPADTPAGVVERVEYDPNRSARIALVKLINASSSSSSSSVMPGGEANGSSPRPKSEGYRYILAPQGVGQGDVVECGPDSPIRPGNSLPLESIPVGMTIHNVELRPGMGGQLARAAGTSCTLIKKGGQVDLC
jgi:large subunit ribosomal protein L2